MFRTSLFLVALALVGCGGGAGLSSYSGPGGAGAGARSGGAQDVALARSKVAAGVVPSVEDLPFEGLYAEHDLPVDGAACGELFCVAAGSAVVDSTSWIQLGMSSNLDLSKFHRAPLNAALVIDTSGSMGTDKMEAVKTAAAKLVDQLNDGDLLTLVRFESTAKTVLGPIAVSDREQFKAQLKTFRAGGGTCIECGLDLGFDAVAKNLDPTRSARVFLMTDAQPNVGATGEGQFTTQLETNAQRGIGLSAFGVGLDFGQQLVTKITAARGANYFFLATPEQMRSIFDKDFELLVTPVAYDLRLGLQPVADSLLGVYGVPGATPSKLESKVATVFLSRTRGAVLATAPGVKPGEPIARASLTFQTPAGVAKTQNLSVTAPAAGAPSYSGTGARRAVTLTRYLVGARKACELYAAGDRAGATREIDAAVKLLGDELAATGDAELRGEADFAKALAALIAR